MKNIPFLLCGVFVVTSLHGQQRGTQPLSIPPGTQIEEIDNYEDNYNYDYDYSTYSGATNSNSPQNYNNIDISQFLIGPGPGALPPMPPTLTNTSEEVLNFIRRNSRVMANSNIQGLSTNANVAQPSRFPAPYAGMVERYPPRAAVGVWWRYYAQNTSIFNIPAACEELLVIAENGDAVWLQNIQTSGTVQSKSQRRLSVSVYEGFGGTDAPLWVFYYPSKENSGANPTGRPGPRNVTNTDTVFNQPSYFVRIFPDQGFMQMSKNPNFPQDQTMYWRYSPRVIPEILAPPSPVADPGARRTNVVAAPVEPPVSPAAPAVTTPIAPTTPAAPTTEYGSFDYGSIDYENLPGYEGVLP
ncbi:MAG: hypothetical protein ACRCY4_06865 [Brevinema sp.]